MRRIHDFATFNTISKILGYFLEPSSNFLKCMLLDQLSPLTGQEPFYTFWVKKEWKIQDFATFKTISSILGYFLVPSSKVAQVHAL